MCSMGLLMFRLTTLAILIKMTNNRVENAVGYALLRFLAIFP